MQHMPTYSHLLVLQELKDDVAKVFQIYFLFILVGSRRAWSGR